MHYFITLVTASPSIETCNDDPMRRGQVRAPVKLEIVANTLTAWATVTERYKIIEREGFPLLVSTSHAGTTFTYTSIRSGYFLDFLKPGGSIIWYQRSVGKSKKKHSILRFNSVYIVCINMECNIIKVRIKVIYN